MVKNVRESNFRALVEYQLRLIYPLLLTDFLNLDMIGLECHAQACLVINIIYFFDTLLLFLAGDEVKTVHSIPISSNDYSGIKHVDV